MTIVASNNITVSNVNDGTITHYAYANIVFLCKENGNFTLSVTSIVRYGSDSRWVYKELQAGAYTATNTLFGGDPASGTQKNVELVDKFSTSNSIDKTHIGVYVDFVESNSVDPSKYNWTLFKGKDGIGIQTTTITYAISTSGTTAPSTGWTSAVPTVPAGSYLWTKTVWDYTDNTSETGYSVAMMGVKGERGKQIFKSSYESVPHNNFHYWSDLSPAQSIDNPPKIGDTVITPSGNILQIDTVNVGGGGGGGTFGVGDVLGNIKGPSGTNGTSGIIVSSVAPSTPQTGQLWQDTSTTPQLVKKWTGNEWVIWAFYAQNLKADSLETVSAIIGKISNTFDNSSGGIDNKGTITIEDSIKVVYYLGNSSTTIDLVTSSSGQGLFTQYLPDKTDASKFKQSWYMPTGLYFTDSINNFNGQITAENVTLSSWQNLILNSGFTAGDGVQPQYRRIKNLDGSYSVQFRGAVSPTSGNFPVSQVQVASISGNYIPQIHTFVQGSDNTGRGGRVAALSDGRIMILAPNNSSYMYLNALTYIN